MCNFHVNNNLKIYNAFCFAGKGTFFFEESRKISSIIKANNVSFCQ